MTEKNTIGITNEFSALKNRIVAGNNSFRRNFLKFSAKNKGPPGDYNLLNKAVQGNAQLPRLD